jgi:hypothetical protein
VIVTSRHRVAGADEGLRAEVPDEGGVPAAAGGGDTAAEDGRELDREGTYPAGAALHEHPLAGFERGVVGQRLPRRQGGERQRRRRLRVRGRTGLRGQFGRRDGGELRRRGRRPALESPD